MDVALFADKLKIANILVRGNVPREQAEDFAEAIAETIAPAVTEDEAAKQIEALDAKTDAKFQAMMARMDARFAQVDARFDVLEEQIRALEERMGKKMAQMEVRIYRAIGFVAALIIAAMSAWAAFG